MKHRYMAALALSALLLTGCAAPAPAETTSGTTAETTVEITFPTQKPTLPPKAVSDYGLADGVYSVEVTLEGGTGRATVLSPARLEITEGQAFATILWSSSNYDYMVVDGQRFDLVSAEGGSAFRIPVAGLDGHLEVIADTVAMGTPHEITYTLFFDSATLPREEA